MSELFDGNLMNLIAIGIALFFAIRSGDWSKLLELLGLKHTPATATGKNRDIKITRDHTLTIGDEEISLSLKELSELAEECDACLEHKPVKK